MTASGTRSSTARPAAASRCDVACGWRRSTIASRSSPISPQAKADPTPRSAPSSSTATAAAGTPRPRFTRPTSSAVGRFFAPTTPTGRCETACLLNQVRARRSSQICWQTVLWTSSRCATSLRGAGTSTCAAALQEIRPSKVTSLILKLCSGLRPRPAMPQQPLR